MERCIGQDLMQVKSTRLETGGSASKRRRRGCRADTEKTREEGVRTGIF